MEQLTKQNPFTKIISLTLVVLMAALAAYTYLTLREAQNAVPPAVINVTGEGEVLGRPDIATFSFGVLAEAEDANTAQQQSAESINAIMDYLQGQGIDEKDIKTQYYNLNPQYDYIRSVCSNEGLCPPGKQVLQGYAVNQTIEVKVRDIDTAGELISGVGELGATNVSSLQFTIDDEEVLLTQARDRAIEDAKQKAKELADKLGVRLVRITGFYEQVGNGRYYPVANMESYGFGGEMDMAAAPNIPTGENSFTSVVNITYEVR